MISALPILIGALLTLPGTPAGSDSAQVPARSAPPVYCDTLPGRSPTMRVGEKLTFSVRWGVVKAGTAVLETTGIRRLDGRPGYVVVSTATSNPVFDKVFPVRDRVVSLMDVDRLHSLYFEKHLREGKYRADQSIRFDHEAKLATYQDGKSFPIERGTFDVLAAFYRVRTMPLKVGQVFFIDSHADRKNYPLRVTVLGREEVETPAGKFMCLVVEPRLRSGAFFKNEGRLTVYLTDDDRRIPVLMRSKIAVGAISVILTQYSRPDDRARAGREDPADAGLPGGADAVLPVPAAPVPAARPVGDPAVARP